MPFEPKTPQQELIHTVVNGFRNKTLLPVEPGPGALSSDPFYLSQKLIDATYRTNISLRQAIDSGNGFDSKVYRVDGRKVWFRAGIAKDLKNDSKAHSDNLKLNYARLFCAYIIGTINTARMYGFSEDSNFLDELNAVQADILDRLQTNLDKCTSKDLEAIMREGKTRLLHVLYPFLSINEDFKEETSFEKIYKSNLALAKNPAKSKGKKAKVSISTAKTEAELAEETNRKVFNIVTSKFLDGNKDWAGVEDETYTVITATSMEGITKDRLVNNKTLVLMDEPLTDLTPTQKHELENYKDQTWFKELPKLKQRVVAHFIPKILKGECGVPSQLRSIAPLCRNFYRQVPAIIEPNGTIVELSPNLHSGTDAYLNREVSDQAALHVTENNFEQVKLNAGTDAVVIINLNSDFADPLLGTYASLKGEAYVGDDSRILGLSEQAANHLQQQRIYAGKYCLNGFRRIPFVERSKTSGIRELFKLIYSNIRQLDAKNSPYRKEYKHQLELLRKAFRYFNVLSVAELLNPIDSDVGSIEIIRLLTDICHINNTLVQRFRDEHPNANYQLFTTAAKFNCASGDNRTGFTEFGAVVEKMVNYFGEEHRLIIAEAIAKSEHIQSMKGGQLATWGTEFFRAKSNGSLPAKFKKLEKYLVAHYGDLKSIDYDANDHLKKEVKADNSSPLLPSFAAFQAEKEAVEEEWRRSNEDERIGFAGSYLDSDIAVVNEIPALNPAVEAQAVRAQAAQAVQAQAAQAVQAQAAQAVQAQAAQAVQAQAAQAVQAQAAQAQQAPQAQAAQDVPQVAPRYVDPNPWLTKETTIEAIDSIGKGIVLPTELELNLKNLKSQLHEQLNGDTSNQNVNVRYKICKVASETNKILTSYNDKIVSLKEPNNPLTVKKHLVKSFAKDANNYENQVMKLSPGRKVIQIGCTLVGGLVGALLGGLLFGSIGLFTAAHVGAGLGGIWGAVKGLHLGVLVGGACATYLSTHFFGKITSSSVRSGLFTPIQGQAYKLKNNLKKDMSEELQTQKSVRRTH